MEVSWSQTPSTVWWALETSSSSINLENMLSPPSPNRDRSNTLSRNQKEAATIFYNYAPDETDLGETEEDIREWVKKDVSRGAIRVYQAGFSYSEIVKCSIETTAETIMARFFSKELFIHYGSKMIRRVRLDEHPLQLLFRFLQEIGHSNPNRLQVEGMNEDLAPLFKFVAGQENGKRPEDSVQLSCSLKVKEVTSIGMSIWNKRFCVLCGSRMFIFPSSQPKGKPNLVLDLRGGKINDYRSKRHMYCLQIISSGHQVLLSFNYRLEQEKWLERAGNVVTKHPLEANLAGHSLEKLPEFYFLNYNLVALNLANNFMIEAFDHTDAALLRQPRSIGWIEDLSIFQRLVSLSLSNNCLDLFPPSVCNIRGLRELDLSCNAIKQIPQEINCLTKLTTLLLHSNQLNTLPYQLHELSHLTTLAIAFNKFFELPPIIMELPSIAILVASGNYISEIPEEINQISTLVHLDLRLNRVSYPLPPSTEGLRSLVRLNVSGNTISEVNTQFVPYLETLNCSGNSLRKLSVNEGPIQTLLAKNNKVTQFSVAPGCDNLTTIDISKNELIVLPDSLAQLSSLEKLLASNNKLTGLPKNLFKMGKLTVVRMGNNHLVSLPQDFIDNCPLEILDLHGNQLSALPEQLFIKAKQLQLLNVSSNKLTTLPAPSSENIKEINSITDFLAANNSLKDSALPAISKFWKLKTLHLAYNDMRVIPQGFFSKLNQLTYLNLAGNSFSSLPPINGCPLLQTLILHSNQLSSLPSVLVFPHLHGLDLSCNQFETLPKLTSFPRLQQLDLSGNTSLSVDIEKEKGLRNIASCCLEGVLDIKGTVKHNTFETGGTTTHGKWSYGSSQITGIENSVNCTVQIKSASLSSQKQDALFAVLDGSRSPEAAKKLKPILPSIMVAEIREEERQAKDGYQHQECLQYLTGTFLTAHRRLGEVATEYGCSTILAHINVLKNGAYVLNVANTGLGEAILCRSGRAVPLTTTHEPSTNSRERTRIGDSRGFISQDGRVNGVCGASRLLGCYHLWPQVIPAPSTESVELRVGDEYIVMGTDGLWKNMTYEQIIHDVHSIADPIRASKRLRDLSVAHGCTTDVSVIVVKLNIDRDPPMHSVLELKKLTPVDDEESSEEESEEEDDDNEITNIDDLISDSEEDEEEEESEEESEDDDSSESSGTTESANGLAGNIDQLILSAVRTPPGGDSRTLPTVQSTNFDDLPTDESLGTPSPLVADSAPQDLPGLIQKTQNVMSQLEDISYVAQTLPKDASKSRRSSKGSTTGYGISETNFETTQSDPALKPINGVRQGALPVKEKFNNVNDRLVALNRALARLEEEEGGGPEYSVESIQRPRKKSTEIKKRLSYVEHSYNRLTNDTYSTGSESLHGTRNTLHLDNWGQ